MHAYLICLDARHEDLAATVLWEAGSSGFEVRPAGSGRIELLAYFATPALAGELAQALPGATVEPVAIPDVDWVARFREGFRAFDAGRFRIVPVWDQPTPGDSVLVVDPGRAFGTGTHETTRLCLAAMEELSGRRDLGRTLDLGSGTGMLAVAAIRLGARTAFAADLDPEATTSSRHHARINHVRLHVVRADLARGLVAGRFDLVLANLMAPLLLARTAEIVALLAPGGTLILSGLLDDDTPAVAAAFSACGHPQVCRDGGWAALTFETR